MKRQSLLMATATVLLCVTLGTAACGDDAVNSFSGVTDEELLAKLLDASEGGKFENTFDRDAAQQLLVNVKQIASLERGVQEGDLDRADSVQRLDALNADCLAITGDWSCVDLMFRPMD